ncbi:MAG TPA: 6-carboxytetrahydropterin synthase [Crocinitomicaceae bacterium]|nr:6-carboxytetrahydropterin synthase [Crocinitomicaceae bacterium]
MKTVYIVRKENFNAAHKLWREEWSMEQNEEVFGKCSNKNWHGHNFFLYVTVKGVPDAKTGFVMDLKKLSRIIKDEVIEKVDHKNLNLDVPFMQGLMPSTENLIIKMWELLEKPITKAGGTLHKLRLEETENNFVEYFGE